MATQTVLLPSAQATINSVQVAAGTVTQPQSFQLTLAWDASPTPQVSGYRIRWGTASGDYSAGWADTPKVLEYTIQLPFDTDFYIIVAALMPESGNQSFLVESPPSNEIIVAARPKPPPIQNPPVIDCTLSIALDKTDTRALYDALKNLYTSPAAQTMSQQQVKYYIQTKFAK
jgi:hypothetical protein